jgi:hypothetical protein
MATKVKMQSTFFQTINLIIQGYLAVNQLGFLYNRTNRYQANRYLQHSRSKIFTNAVITNLLDYCIAQLT